MGLYGKKMYKGENYVGVNIWNNISGINMGGIPWEGVRSSGRWLPRWDSFDRRRYPEVFRRKPGQNKFVTPRKEDDAVEILSGVFEGKTTGTPISMLVYNKCQRSADYSEIASYYRPGHADYTYNEKYGFRDYRGGGRSSGRETWQQAQLQRNC